LQRIDTETDIAEAVAALLAADPRLLPIHELVGEVPLRRRAGGFEGLAAIVTAQQISTAAAAAIWARLEAAVRPLTPAAFLAVPEAALQEVGLSRAKIRTLSAIAAACADGLDIEALHEVPAEEAIRTLVSLKGIGPWTAEIYLLFCIGHPDVFPAGDLALQTSVQHALRLRTRPDEKHLRKLAERWAPWRGAAARLFWAYYRVRRNMPAGVVPFPAPN
jgi:DNA-3-methyladenine glycosylase II